MKLLDCKSCGSKELVEENGLIVCVYCQSTYVPQADDVPAMETKIGLTSDIETLLLKCEQDPANSRRYANLILDIDPTNAQARQYLDTGRRKKRWYE